MMEYAILYSSLNSLFCVFLYLLFLDPFFQNLPKQAPQIVFHDIFTQAAIKETWTNKIMQDLI